MRQRSPVTSSTPVMWAALRRLRNHGKVEQHDERCQTLDALERRGWVCRVELDDWAAYAITQPGRDVLRAIELGKRLAW